MRNDTALPRGEEPETNPFAPSFGIAPPFMVGRERLLARIKKGLRAGPGKPGFTNTLSGVRGSGKTVLLQTVEDYARSAGWAVLSIPDSKNVLFAMQEAIKKLPEQYEWLDLDKIARIRTTSKTQTLDLRVFAAGKTTTESQHFENQIGMPSLLKWLAQSAAENDTVALLTLDELHVIDTEEARTLFTGIQQITNSEKLPLAFFGTGLPDMHYTLFKEKVLTFFRRCRKHKMPPLTFDETIEGIKIPIEKHDGTIHHDALVLMSEHVKGLPYALQTVGDSAWEIANAPQNPIDIEVAKQAIAISEELVAEDIQLPSLDDLNRHEREYLISLARLGEHTSDDYIRENIDMDPHEIYEAERRLLVSGYITKTEEGTRELSNLVPRDTLLSITNMMKIPARPYSGIPNNVVSTNLGRCDHWMPRAKKRCVLSAGHKGVCRSK